MSDFYLFALVQMQRLINRKKKKGRERERPREIGEKESDGEKRQRKSERERYLPDFRYMFSHIFAPVRTCAHLYFVRRNNLAKRTQDYYNNLVYTATSSGCAATTLQSALKTITTILYTPRRALGAPQKFCIHRDELWVHHNNFLTHSRPVRR